MSDDITHTRTFRIPNIFFEAEFYVAYRPNKRGFRCLVVTVLFPDGSERTSMHRLKWRKENALAEASRVAKEHWAEWERRRGVPYIIFQSPRF